LVISNHLHLEVLPRPVDSAQYTSWAFGRRLRAAGVLGSMGSIGDAYDCEHDPPAWRVSATTLVGCQQVAA